MTEPRQGTQPRTHPVPADHLDFAAQLEAETGYSIDGEPITAEDQVEEEET